MARTKERGTSSVPGRDEGHAAGAEDENELVDEGLVRNIGASNLVCDRIRDVMHYSRIKPAVLQNEVHPYLVRDDLVRFCHFNGIAITAYSSFGASSYFELGMAGQNENVLIDPVVVEIAKKHDKSTAQIALKWAV